MPKVLSQQDIAGFRERLCDAAEALFAEHGAEAVTMRQISAKLEVSPMTPYRYFSDKQAILAAVRARAFERFAAALEEANAASRHDQANRGRAIGKAYLHFAFANPEAYKLMFDLSQPGEELYPDLNRAARRARATMTLHLKDGGAAGLQGDLDLIGHAYWAAMHGPIMLQLAGKLSHPHDAVALIALLTDALDKATHAAHRDS